MVVYAASSPEFPAPYLAFNFEALMLPEVEDSVPVQPPKIPGKTLYTQLARKRRSSQVVKEDDVEESSEDIGPNLTRQIKSGLLDTIWDRLAHFKLRSIKF